MSMTTIDQVVERGYELVGASQRKIRHLCNLLSQTLPYLESPSTYSLRRPSGLIAEIHAELAAAPNVPAPSTGALPSPVVHILWHGLALCGRRDLPNRWPANHSWIHEHEVRARHPRHLCPGCECVHLLRRHFKGETSSIRQWVTSYNGKLQAVPHELLDSDPQRLLAFIREGNL